VLWREGKYYVAQCLNTNISSFGETKAEALFNINEALELYFEDNTDPTIINIEEPELIQSCLSYA
jgi:predicted RNase H-like HicB family nuclease